MAVTTLDFPTIEVKNQGILPRAALYIGRNGYIPRWSGLSSLMESKIYDDGTTLRFETLSGTSPSSNYLTVDTSGNVIPTSIPSISTGNLTSTDITVSGGTGAVVGAGTSLTLATVNANTGTWGSATQVPQFTVNGKGLITAVSNVTITPAASSITGVLGVTQGGTGTSTTFTQGSVIFAGASGVYSQNNSQLFWDNSNNRLGVGKNTSLNARLHIAQNSGTSSNRVMQIDGVSNNIFNIQENGNSTFSGHMKITASTVSSEVLEVENTGTGYAAYFSCYGNFPAGSVNSAAFHYAYNGSVGNNIQNLFLLRNNTSASASSGLGCAIGFLIKNSATPNFYSGYISQCLTTVTAGSEDSRIDFVNRVAGTLTNAMAILGEKVGIGILSPKSTLDINGSIGAVVRRVATGETMSTSYTTYILTNSAASNQTFTCPTIASSTNRIYFLKNQSQTYNMTIDGDGSEEFIPLGAVPVTSFDLAPGEACMIQNDGTYWNIL